MYSRDIVPGAFNAIVNCLKVQPHETLCIITDRRSRHIAAALRDQAEAVNARVKIFELEAYGGRPLAKMPEEILDCLVKSDAGIFCAQTVKGEIHARIETIHVVESCDVRYAHMVNITNEVMRQGMCADFEQVYNLGEKLIAIARGARTARIRTAIGTDFHLQFDPGIRWLNTGGRITAKKWSNLPAGEIFTAPEHCEGVFVADGSIGDYLCSKYGCIDRTPMKLHIENSRLVDIACDNEVLQADFWNYCRTDVNSDRVGEFAIGTNSWVERCIGNLLQDEKMPGVHIAFGDPARGQTGADWSAKTHIDVIAQNCDIWLDDIKIMEKSRFLID